MLALHLTVYGIPAPQGSLVRGRYGGLHSSSKRLATWREAVRATAANARNETLAGPVAAEIVFTMRRPKTKGQEWPIKRPDLDKLCRAVFDALTDAGVWADDSQVVSLIAHKVFSGDSAALDAPGAEIKLYADTDEAAAAAACEVISIEEKKAA